MSTSDLENASFPDERKKTDKSLGDERAKTDASLLARKKRTERQVDAAIQSKRDENDDTRSQIRHDADDSSSKGGKVQTGSKSAGHPDSDERLRQERLSADEALDTERRHVDDILKRERRQKGRDEQSHFQAERKKTDTDLSNERVQTDAQARKATVALTTRDEFLAIVSHDLRNPLGSICSAADLLVTLPHYAQADKASRQFIEMIGRSASEALRLISDLMDMESIAAGKLSLEAGKYDIAEIIRHAVQSFQPQAVKKELTLQLVFQVEHPVYALCDRDRVSQVLANLIGNALKFTPSGGKVALTVLPETEEIQISIADSGPGIPKAMQEIIFERFWQIGKPDRRGLGLGLYISKTIIEAHHGRLWVESEMEHGSKFHLTLPTVA